MLYCKFVTCYRYWRGLWWHRSLSRQRRGVLYSVLFTCEHLPRRSRREDCSSSMASTTPRTFVKAMGSVGGIVGNNQRATSRTMLHSRLLARLFVQESTAFWTSREQP